MPVTHPGRQDENDRRLLRNVDAYFAGLGQGVNAYLERRARMDELRDLNRLSDEELLKRGLRRDLLPRHVFGEALGE